jgi:hypothetical protein
MRVRERKLYHVTGTNDLGKHDGGQNREISASIV